MSTVYTYNDKALKNITTDKWLKKLELPPTIYQVTTSATHGTVTASPTEGISGTEVTLSNTPDTHYHFGSYSLTGATLKNANQFDIADSDVSVVGNFIEDTKYSVTVNQSTGGTISASPTIGYTGTEVTLSNTPAYHYSFGSYNLTGATLKSANKFDIGNSNVTVGATWIEDTKYTVTCTNDGHGTIAASPTSNYSGSTVTLSNTPNSGYTFDKYTIISGTGASISGNTLTIGTSNVTVRGNFKTLVPQLQYRKVVCTPLNSSGRQYPMININRSQYGTQYVYKAYKWSNGVKEELNSMELDQLLSYGFMFESVIEVYLYLDGVNSVSILPMQPNRFLPQLTEVYNFYTDNSQVLVDSKTLNNQYEEFTVSFT